jgi:gas vesicle protein
MKNSTKKKIRETAKRGAIKAREVADEVKKMSDQVSSSVKGKMPSKEEVRGAAKAAAKFASKTALETKDKTRKIAGIISETSRDIIDSVKEGVEDAKRENAQKDNSL